jgi:hypothetical protein
VLYGMESNDESRPETMRREEWLSALVKGEPVILKK